MAKTITKKKEPQEDEPTSDRIGDMPVVTDETIKHHIHKMVPIEKLTPYQNNPRKHTDLDVRIIMHSLAYYGWANPLQVQKGTNLLISGHGRLEAAKRLGLKMVPVVELDLNEMDSRGYRIMDNRSAELSYWDDAPLNTELVELDSLGFNVGLTGFSDEELRERMEGKFGKYGLTDDDEAPPVPKNPKTKKGDIYQMGGHRLVCGDATNDQDIYKLLDGKKADLVFTDPPYNVDYEGYTQEKLKIKNDKMSGAEFIEFLEDSFRSYRIAIKDGASLYVCHPDWFQREFQNALEDAGFKIRTTIVWVKNTFGWGYSRYKFQHEGLLYAYVDGESDPWYGDKSQSTVWHENKPAANRLHPTMKPVELVQRALVNSSKSGDLILDLFGGSGSTLIACEKMKRRCFTMEMDPGYCDVIVQRYEDFTGSKAVRAGD